MKKWQHVPRVVVNCANLHVGGGVAVATSFIQLLSEAEEKNGPNFEVHVLASSEVDENVRSLGVSIEEFGSYRVIDFFGLSSVWGGLGALLSGYDVVFTVFGPAYTLGVIDNHIVGFAQPNILYPVNPVYNDMMFLDKVITRLKFFVQKIFFSRASILVVELPHVEAGLRRQFFFKRHKIEMVESAVHSIYYKRERWDAVDFPSESPSVLKLGVVSKNYPHKNLSIFPRVREVLKRKFKLDVDFYVTLSEEEFNSCGDEFKNGVVNVGKLKLSQCPSFYEYLDGVVFPTFLECYSAVPIEALVMRKPLFVSDRSFMRDICVEHASYFDPMCEESIAISIFRHFNLPASTRSEAADAGYDYAMSLPSAYDRSERYLGIIKSIIERGDCSNV